MRTTRLDDDWQEPPHFHVKKLHGQLLIDRLSKLLHAGYRINIRYVHEGLGIPLTHPNKKVPDIEIYGDGLVNDQFPSQLGDQPDYARTLFEPEDTREFDQFVARIPRPNFIQQIGMTPVGEAVSLTIGSIILLGFFWVVGKLLEGGWHWLRDAFS